MGAAGATFHSAPLVDTAGAMTTVSIEFDSNGLGFHAAETDEPHTQEDDEALLDDILWVGGPHTMTIHGAQPGFYSLYVYAMAPDFPMERTTVAVQVSTYPAATVGGEFSRGYRRNVTHSVHGIEIPMPAADIVILIDFLGTFRLRCGTAVGDGAPMSLPDRPGLLPSCLQLDGSSVTP